MSQLLEHFLNKVGERQALQVLLESWRRQRQDAWGEEQVVEVSRWSVTIQGTMHDVRGLGEYCEDERYKDKMNQLKNVREGKSSYTEKLNIHVPS